MQYRYLGVFAPAEDCAVPRAVACTLYRQGWNTSGPPLAAPQATPTEGAMKGHIGRTMSQSRLDVDPLGSSSRSVHFDSPEHMVRALGAHDEVLQVIEAEFTDVNLHVRGNELSISGPAEAVQLTLNLVEEIRALAAKDTRITPQVVAQLLRMLGEQT